MAIALILILIAVGSVLFHVLSPWWWTPIASNWQYIDDTIIITFWITGAVFVAIVAFMVAVYEAPDDAVAARFNLQLGMLGNIRTRTLKAFPEAAYREIIASLG